MAQELATILAFGTSQRVVAAIWGRTRHCAASCSACCWAWHAAQQAWDAELQQLQAEGAGGHAAGGHAAARAGVLSDVLAAARQLDGERMQAWLEAVAAAVLDGDGGTLDLDEQGRDLEAGGLDGVSRDDLMAMATQETFVW